MQNESETTYVLLRLIILLVGAILIMSLYYFATWYDTQNLIQNVSSGKEQIVHMELSSTHTNVGYVTVKDQDGEYQRYSVDIDTYFNLQEYASEVSA